MHIAALDDADLPDIVMRDDVDADALVLVRPRDTDRSWVTELAGIAAASAAPIGHRVDKGLTESGFGDPQP